MTEIYLCPNCAKPLTETDKCDKCGWVPGMYMTDGEIRNSVFQWLDDKKGMGTEPAQADINEVVNELGITHGKARAYKREYLKESGVLDAKERAILLREQACKEAEARPAPTPAPIQTNPAGIPMGGGIPDWALQPYRAQIEMLKGELDRERRRFEALEVDYREKLLQPAEGKFSKLEAKLMDNFTDYALKGGQPKSWVEELVGGLVGSGQLGTILEEGAGLLTDLRNKDNPEHDPYADVQYAPQPPPIKKTRRPVKPGQPPAAQQSEQQEELIDIPEEPEVEEPEYTVDEIKALVKQTYPKIPPDVVDIAVNAAEAEVPAATTREKVMATIETLKAAAMLRDIGIGLKQVVQGNIPIDTAAKYLLKNHPNYARSLAQTGYEVWLEKGKYFAEHPNYGKDIEFLNRDEVRSAMGQIVSEVKQLLQEG